jgi:hypothetical protein
MIIGIKKLLKEKATITLRVFENNMLSRIFGLRDKM